MFMRRPPHRRLARVARLVRLLTERGTAGRKVRGISRAFIGIRMIGFNERKVMLLGLGERIRRQQPQDFGKATFLG